MTTETTDIGKLAYNAYCEARGWKSVAGQPLPTWEDQSEDLRIAWREGACAVSHEIKNRTNEDHIMQLAAISTAAFQNVRESDDWRIKRDSPYWTQAYADVCTTVDREMRERERAEKAEAELDRVKSHVRCMYCSAEYAYADKDKLADHILTCEKSPLVQQVKEMQIKTQDWGDLICDEQKRIKALTDNTEIHGICDRMLQVFHQHVPVIQQRDDALARAEKVEAELDRARAANQEMREMLTEVYEWCVTDNPSDIDGDAVKRVLDSTTCGTDYIARDKVRPLYDALLAMHANAQESCEVYFKQDNAPVGMSCDLGEAYSESNLAEQTTSALAAARELGIGGGK